MSLWSVEDLDLIWDFVEIIRLLPYMYFETVLCSAGWPRIPYIAKASFEHLILLTLPLAGIAALPHQFTWCWGLSPWLHG